MTTYRCKVQGTFPSGLSWSFRQHFESGAAIAQVMTDWTAALTSWWTDGTNGMQGIYPTGTVFELASVSALSGVPFREGAFAEHTFGLAGALSTDSLPEQNCILVTLRAADKGPKNRGRIHYPAPAEDQVTGGVLNTTPAGHVAAATTKLYQDMRNAGHTPVLYNVKVSKVPTVDPIVQTLKTIVSEDPDRVIRTQRRRVKRRKAQYV